MNSQRFYHGTKADLKPGDLIELGYKSNYVQSDEVISYSGS
ncbi:MAG TPA: NAD(+)--rifampin ADP-ribosyltransferase, partial [Gemmatimonadota bacterium]|nr:NAD(+)--rifampin ADP-ribosyltransferase [Gemmatimonadota bacterium]